MKEQVVKHTSSNAVYGLGFLGAAIYFISNATGLWDGIIGVVKAIFWPAYLAYEACKYLNL